MVPLVPAPIVALEMSLAPAGLDVNVSGGVGLKVTDKGKRTIVSCSLRGELFRFEKLLLVDEAPKIKLMYRRRAP